MKNSVLTIAAAILVLTFSSVNVQAQATVTGHVFAEVVEALSIGESSSMNFGRFSTGDQGGSIVIPTNGSALATSSVVSADTNINPATFSVSGAKDAAFSVTLPDGPATLTNLDGGTMKVTDWTATSGEGTEAYVLAGGSQTVRVGATLQVGNTNDNPKGIYTGSYKITFAYN